MTTRPSTAGLVPLVAALLAFAGPLYAFGRWAAVWDAQQPRETVVAAFMAGFPGWLPSPQSVTWASALACAIAFVAGLLARRRLEGALRGVANLLLGFAALLGAWNLFTLM